MLPSRTPVVISAATIAALALALSGCAAGTGSTADDGRIRVVASTDVYGDIATQVGGDGVDVTSIIDSSAQDPHSYEASARDRLAVSRADLIIVNGGGYDDFMQQLGIADSDATILDVAELAGLKDGANEHLWYDFDTMDEVAAELAMRLGEVSGETSTDAAAFEAGAGRFSAGIDELRASVDQLRDAHAGESVAITEPVPLYLLLSVGLRNVTPDAFSEAIEEGTDVPPLVLQTTIGLFGAGGPVLLAYNDQTSGPETEKVRSAAEAAGVPVVDFAETLPDGKDYLQWMTQNVQRIAAALSP